MKKIIAVIDGLKYSGCTTNYAMQIAKATNSHLVGIFLDDKTYSSYKIYDLLVQEGMTENKLKEFEKKDTATRNKAAALFENACRKEGVTYSIHHDRNIALQEVLHESIYADLLIIDSKETFTHYNEKLPTRFIRNLLAEVQCPAVIVSSKYKPIQKVILLYDGGPSSVYAIKEFSYLLPEFKNIKTEILSVNPEDSTLRLPDIKLMKEFMTRHFPDADYNVIKGWAEDEIVKHLKQQKESCLVVLGAYRRGTVSRWFRESMADLLMKEQKHTLFVAHNK